MTPKTMEDNSSPAYSVNINLLRSAKEQYHSGSTIEGTVVLQLTNQSAALGFMIVFSGEVYVHWTGGENIIRSSEPGQWMYAQRSNYRCGSSEKIIDSAVQLFGDNRTSNLIEAGRHEFPFRFQLPSGLVLPRSYTYDRPTDGSPTGCIKYTLEARLYVSQNAKPFTTEIVVPVTEIVDIDLPHLASPLSVSKVSGSGWLCCYNGPVSTSVKIDRGGYCLGDSILINLEVTNRRVVTVVRAILKQRVVFHGYCNNFTRRRYYSTLGNVDNTRSRMLLNTRKTKIIQTIEDRDIAGNGEIYNWIDKPLHIPTDLVPTISSCKTLQVSYILTVSISIRYASDCRVKLPIIVGNVPRPPDYQ